MASLALKSVSALRTLAAANSVIHAQLQVEQVTDLRPHPFRLDAKYQYDIITIPIKGTWL